VVELGSFARAAEALELSRARASEVVKDLEAALDTLLLHRTTRRLSLTDSGRAYFERVTAILTDIADAETEIRSARATVQGRLRVDMPVGLTRLYVLPQLPRLLRRHPGLELEIRLENRSIELMREGVDCAVAYGPPTDQELVVRFLAKTRLVTCAAPSYCAKHRVPKHPRDLLRHNCIGFLAPQTARPVPWQFFDGEMDLSQRVTGNLASNSMEACVEAAAMGLGVTQVLSSVAHQALQAGRVVALLERFVSQGPGLYFTYPVNRRASARLLAFGEFLQEVFVQIDAGPGSLP
jgi:LysR family transcriptional regulator for bpeEF and oprC